METAPEQFCRASKMLQHKPYSCLNSSWYSQERPVWSCNFDDFGDFINWWWMKVVPKIGLQWEDRGSGSQAHGVPIADAPHEPFRVYIRERPPEWCIRPGRGKVGGMVRSEQCPSHIKFGRLVLGFIEADSWKQIVNTYFEVSYCFRIYKICTPLSSFSVGIFWVFFPDFFETGKSTSKGVLLCWFFQSQKSR